MRPDFEGSPVYYRTYLEYVKNDDLFDALRESGKQMQTLVASIPETLSEYRYEPGKWTLKESLCHVMDVERVFAYRALRFARNDKTELHGYNDNDYAVQANAHARTFKRLSEEAMRLRLSTIDLFESFTEEMFSRTGIANSTELSVLNLGYIISGHERHHRKIITERYLKDSI